MTTYEDIDTWDDRASVAECRMGCNLRRDIPIAYTRWYVATMTGEKVWYLGFDTKSGAADSLLYALVKKRHLTAFVVKGERLMRVYPDYRVMVKSTAGTVLDDCFETNDRNAPFDTVTHEAVKVTPRTEICSSCNGRGTVKCWLCSEGYRHNEWGDERMCDCDSDFRRDCKNCYGEGEVELPPLVLDGSRVTNSTVTPSVKVEPPVSATPISTAIQPLTCTVPTLLLPAMCATTLAARAEHESPLTTAIRHTVLHRVPQSINVHASNRHVTPVCKMADPTPKQSVYGCKFTLYSEPLMLTAPDDSFGGFYPLSDKLPDVRVLTSDKSGPAFQTVKDRVDAMPDTLHGYEVRQGMAHFQKQAATLRAGR